MIRDEFATVPIIRSASSPEGWRDEDAEEASRIVARMAVLRRTLHKRGATFSVENPFGSYIWLLKAVQRLFKLEGVDLVLLHK